MIRKENEVGNAVESIVDNKWRLGQIKELSYRRVCFIERWDPLRFHRITYHLLDLRLKIIKELISIFKHVGLH